MRIDSSDMPYFTGLVIMVVIVLLVVIFGKCSEFYDNNRKTVSIVKDAGEHILTESYGMLSGSRIGSSNQPDIWVTNK